MIPINSCRAPDETISVANVEPDQRAINRACDKLNRLDTTETWSDYAADSECRERERCE